MVGLAEIGDHWFKDHRCRWSYFEWGCTPSVTLILIDAQIMYLFAYVSKWCRELLSNGTSPIKQLVPSNILMSYVHQPQSWPEQGGTLKLSGFAISLLLLKFVTKQPLTCVLFLSVIKSYNTDWCTRWLIHSSTSKYWTLQNWCKKLAKSCWRHKIFLTAMGRGPLGRRFTSRREWCWLLRRSFWNLIDLSWALSPVTAVLAQSV